jgi:alkylation response protein AidB-like acyl-CoA dehydrogenase
VDFALAEDQQALLDGVDALLARHAGAARATELATERAGAGGYDAALDAALAEAGFDRVLDEVGPLEAALLVERVAFAAGCCAIAGNALIGPAVAGGSLPGPVAVAEAGEEGPVRFAGEAQTLLVLDGDAARRVTLEPGDATPVRSNFGYPMARLRAAARRRGDSLGPGSGPRLAAWWRLARAAECLGAMDAALGFTVRYLTEREQFGRPIGSFQAVQHRLADCAVQVQATRWLVYETAANGATPEAAATCASYAGLAAGQVHRETHQLSGAIGYTTEHDLHVWSMRLQALRLEQGGMGAQLRALAGLRWDAPA